MGGEGVRCDRDGYDDLKLVVGADAKRRHLDDVGGGLDREPEVMRGSFGAEDVKGGLDIEGRQEHQADVAQEKLEDAPADVVDEAESPWLCHGPR